jgi:muramidase (phage lysozyme)
VQASIEVLGTKVGMALSQKLQGSFAQFDRFLQRNAGAIVSGLTRIVDGVLVVIDALARAGSRIGEAIVAIHDWFLTLSPDSQELITRFGEIVIAWRLLNTAFLTSPLGLILSFAAALALLYEDYKTWKEGGDSLIDWTKWEPSILKAEGALKYLIDQFNALGVTTEQWQHALEALALFIAGSWATRVVLAIGKVAAGLASLAAPGWIINLISLLSRMAGPLVFLYTLLRPNGSIDDNESRNLSNALRGDAAAPTWLKEPTRNQGLPPEARALLDTIAGPESAGAYNVRWGGIGKPDATFNDFSKHPNIPEPGPAGPSTAAGRYQITNETWREFAPGVGVTDFQPGNQDIVGWSIASKRYKAATGGDLLTDLRDPSKRTQVEAALRATWPTINMSPYDANLAVTSRGAAGRLPGPSIPGATPGTSDSSPRSVSPQGMDAWEYIVGRTALGGGGGSNVAIQQNNTFHINGASSPEQTAGAVANKVTGANADLQRGMQGAVR